MATAATRVGKSMTFESRLPGRRFDHWFFNTAAVLMLITVFTGFARSYFLAGMFRAPLPSLIIHVHGAVFTAWILLLVTQTSLVSAGRVDIHRRLGIAGFLLAGMMIVVGVLAATDSLVRAGGPAGRDPKAFYIVPLSDILIFGTLVFFAIRKRRDPASHKRYIYVATTALLIAAVARIPIMWSYRRPLEAGWVSDIFLAALIAYDLWSTHKVHRATLWAGAFLLVVQQVRFPISQTAAWHGFATWAQALAR